jgi:hypothetical protein
MTRFRLTAFFALGLAAACAARPLTQSERAFTDSVMGPAIDAEDVRIVKGAAVGALKTTIPPRPRTTCRQKLGPARTEPVPGSYAAMALGPAVFYRRVLWEDDFLADYPEAIDLRDAMRLAHELTHVWQWQRRDLTGYHPLKASFEHLEKDDPYLVEIDPGKRFLDYAYEQQGAIVEEFVCCRALDPQGARTERLYRLVAQVFPGAARLGPVPADGIRLPWKGAQTQGICS